MQISIGKSHWQISIGQFPMGITSTELLYWGCQLTFPIERVSQVSERDGSVGFFKGSKKSKSKKSIRILPSNRGLSRKCAWVTRGEGVLSRNYDYLWAFSNGLRSISQNLTKSKFYILQIWQCLNSTLSEFDQVKIPYSQNLTKSKFHIVKIWLNQNSTWSKFD